ncbi:MAG TPA: hypothetical protein VMX56_01470 [Anaerolineales bacterium]|nr:hypothetical protein [Anaerolineales bacterium]
MGTASRLLIGIFIGLLLGLLFGWVIRPVEYVDTSPEALREDFRSDYVLMVAEAYLVDRDLELARYRLASLGSRPSLNYVIDAIDFGVENGFNQIDLQTLNQLAVDIRSIPPAPEIGLQ